MPKLEQAFTVARPPLQVWAALRDAEAVVACLPGASLEGPPGEDGAIKGALKVKLGPIAASFGGQGKVQYDDAAMTGTLEGGGADRGSGSRAKGTARFAATEAAPGSTRVAVEVDYALSGTLAQFARGGIVEDIARRMVEAFAANLEARLAPPATPAEAPAAEVASPASATPSATAPPPTPAGVELNLLRLVFERLWHRLRALLGLPPRTP